MPRPDRGIRIFRLLLRAYPRTFRQEHGAAMEQLFRLRRRQADQDERPFRRLRFWGWILRDVGVTAVPERLEGWGWRSRKSGAGPGSYAGGGRPDDAPNRGGVVDAMIAGLGRTIRNLRKRPLFTAVVVLTLALGIGANTAVFTVLDAVLLEPLPYPEPDRLVRVYEEEVEDPGSLEFVAGLRALAYRESEVFDGVAMLYTYREQGADLTGGDRPERIRRLPVSADYFQVLGVRPALGRGFTRDEERPDARLAVISHGLWQRRFDGSRDAVGASLSLDGEPHTVVGVMPPEFQNPFGGPTDVWTPENLIPEGRNSWGNHYLSAVARLPEGTTRQTVQARLRALDDRLAETEPDAGFYRGALVPLHDDVVGGSRALLWVLMAAVALVLLSAVVNVANLSLARSLGRSRELAVRAALGSGRRRLVAQLLGESLGLALLGGAAGLLLGVLGVQALVGVAPEGLTRLEGVDLDASVFLFTLVVTGVTGVLFGLVPATALSRTDPGETLRDGSRGSTAGPWFGRLRSGLVVVEMAVAVVLLVGAGLLLRSFAALQDVDLAIETEGLVTFEVHLPESRYPEGADRTAFHDALGRRVEALPGVRSRGATSYLPAQGRYHVWGARWTPPGGEPDWYGTDVRVVDGDYFGTLGIELLSGRLFDARDDVDQPPVVVVNRTFVEQTFGGEEPLGQQLGIGGGEPRTVIGVVEDVPFDPRGSVSPKLYMPHRQYAADRNWALIQTVATTGDVESVMAGIRRELAALDPDLVVYRTRTMDDLLAAGVAEQRFAMFLMGVFAGLALTLAAVGVFGVLSFMVGRRTHEIGIRMALGAKAGDVRRLVLRQGLVLGALGIALGTGAAWASSRWLASLVFEVRLTDPWVYGAAAAGLAAVAVVAGWLPAFRATRIDPVRAFRAE